MDGPFEENLHNLHLMSIIVHLVGYDVSELSVAKATITAMRASSIFQIFWMYNYSRA